MLQVAEIGIFLWRPYHCREDRARRGCACRVLHHSVCDLRHIQRAQGGAWVGDLVFVVLSLCLV